MIGTSKFALDVGSSTEFMKWHCEPASWSIDVTGREVHLQTRANTDFWQRTHYGFQADNGHFLYLPIDGDFVVTSCVTAVGRNQYDQAGLMLRMSENCWLKTSIECEPNEATNRLGAVVTNMGHSDWSTQSVDRSVETVWFRIDVKGPTCIVFTSVDGQTWEQIRVAQLLERTDLQALGCGVYACSPKAAGFEVRFRYLHIERSHHVSALS